MPQLFGPRLASSPDQLQAPQESDPFAQVEQFLSTLQTAPIPQAQKTKVWQNVVGSLGDAILSMARVRAGGGPGEGPFAQSLRARQSQIASQQQAAEETNRQLENDVRIMAFKEQLTRGRPQEVSTIRSTRFAPTTGFLPRTQIFRDEGGNIFMSSTTIGTEGVGETTLKNLDPRGPAEPRGTLVPVNPAPSTVTTSRGVEVFDPRRETLKPTGQFPAPSEETQRAVGSAGGFRFGLDQLRRLFPAYTERRDKEFLGEHKRIGQQIVRRAPIIGSQLSERMDVGGEDLGAVLDRVRADFTRMMSGLQASELEQARLLRTLPDLGTIDTATALRRIDNFEAGALSFLRERARLRPDLFGQLAQEDRDFIGESGGEQLSEPPGSTRTFSGRSMTRQQFDSLKPSEQKRWLDGGGTVQ